MKRGKEFHDLPEHEQTIEIVWERTGGIVPDVVTHRERKVWFTPRMARNVARLKRAVATMDVLQELASKGLAAAPVRPVVVR